MATASLGRYAGWVQFMAAPNPGLVWNQTMDDQKVHVATKFVDELILALNVLLQAADQNLVIENNFPLFLVPKAGQPEKYRCIAGCKLGGQNDICVNDPCHMASLSHILPHLYTKGWSMCVDFSKYFHMFKTLLGEHKYLRIVHPKTGVLYFYGKFPSGFDSLLLVQVVSDLVSFGF